MCRSIEHARNLAGVFEIGSEMIKAGIVDFVREAHAAFKRWRLEVLPGLTGLWQVNARQDSLFEAYMALDTLYIETRSLGLDLKILLKTIGLALAGTGS
jgi:lipopolysaccharide/colanic/teichoic acid biosynthesis glycosyltransferase